MQMIKVSNTDRLMASGRISKARASPSCDVVRVVVAEIRDIRVSSSCVRLSHSSRADNSCW